MEKTERKGGGRAQTAQGIYAKSIYLFIYLYPLTDLNEILFQEKQAKRKISRAEEEKRLAQKKKEEEERRQREIGKFGPPKPESYLLICKLD